MTSSNVSALQFTKIGDFREVVRVSTISKPRITKPFEVLVQVKAATVNPADKAYIAGQYAPITSFPATGGYEAAGVVVEVGAAVQNYKVGQHVHFAQIGSTWAEYVIFDSNNQFATVVPDDISFEYAAQITVNPIAVFAIFAELNVNQGDTIILTAAGSTLGRIAIQVAKSIGIRTICIVRRDKQIEELKRIGADFVINSENGDFLAQINKIAPKGVPYLIDAVGGKVGTMLIKALCQGGVALVIGVLGGTAYAPPVVDILFKNLSIKGFWLVTWGETHKDRLPGLYQKVIEHIQKKSVILEYKTFDAKAQFKEAFEHSITPGKSEKTVLLF